MIKSLSIIFPLYNEEQRLKASFNHILSFIKKKPTFKIEIIFVDDGSDDKSYELIKQFIKNSKKNTKIKFKIIKSKKNLGKGSALKLGIKKAEYDWILTTDIDMSVSLFQIYNWVEKKLVNKKYLKLKILGTGEIKKNIEISAHFASKQALSKIEKAGGKISIIKK